MIAVLKLVQNELIKLKNQLSWKIITCFILVISIGVPILNSLTLSSGCTFSWQDKYENAEEGSVEREYYKTGMELQEYMDELGIAYDDWRYEYYFYDYSVYIEGIKAIQLIQSGMEPSEVFSWFSFPDIIDIEYEFFYYHLDEETGQYIESEFTDELLEQLLMEYQELAEQAKQKLSITFAEFAEETAADINGQLAALKEEYEAAKALYEADSSLETDYRNKLYKYEFMQYLSEAWSNAGNTEKEDEYWVVSTLDMMYILVNYCSENLEYLSREEFDRNGTAYAYGERYDDYDMYEAALNEACNDMKAALELLNYSIENKIKIPADGWCIETGESVRYEYERALTVNVWVVMFFCIFLAAVIVASEHSSGAIRLLLIRPRARWKILLSKLLTVIIYGICALVLTSLLSLLTTVMIYGWGDLSVPYLSYVSASGAVTETAPLPHWLFKMSVVGLPALFAMLAAFALSVIVKRSVFSLGISLLIDVSGSTVSWLCYYLIGRFPFLELTPLPYLDLTNMIPDVIANSYYQMDYTYGLSLGMGTGVLLIYTAALAVISFVVFCKQRA